MAPASRFAQLIARPPTPPKDLTSDPVPLPSATTPAITSLLDTPDTPSVSTPDYFSSKPHSRGKKRKRVNFILTPTTGNSSSPLSLPDLPSSSADKLSTPTRIPTRGGKPGKSILKRTSYGLLSDITINSDDLGVSLTFSSPLDWKSNKVKMLNEALKQLASSDKSTRLDAYQSITSAMKKYDDLPRLDEFLERVPIFMEYVNRDLRNRKGTDHRDGQLVLEALKLATIMTWRNPATLSEAAKVDLLQWCIETIQDSDSTKVILNNTLFLISSQKFDKALNAQRVSKILRVLETIETRVSGNQVKNLRLTIYRRITTQTPVFMNQFASLWLVPLIEGLLSEKKDLAQNALKLGRDMGIELGQHLETSKALEKLLNTPVPSRETSPDIEQSDNQEPRSQTYAEVLASKLDRMANDKSRSESVPKIWSILVLLLQRRRSVIIKGRHVLQILQFCLNKVTSKQTKTRAVIAWRDLIFALRNDMQTNIKTLDLASKLFPGLFRRDDSDKSRTETESTFCTFLYYALWPKATNDMISEVWSKQIAMLLNPEDPKSRTRQGFSLRVLAALFGNHPQVAWDERRALHDIPLQPEDLPRIEPRWIADNFEPILDVLAGHLSRGYESEDMVYAVWQGFNRCIVEARKHEIRPSASTMTALAAILTFTIDHTNRILSNAGTDRPSRGILGHIYRLLTSTFSSFGPIPCNEKVLWVDEDNHVRTTEVSAKHAAPSEDKQSALDIAMTMLNADCAVADGPLDSFEELITLIVRRKLEAAQSKSRRLQILAELSEETICPEDHHTEAEQASYCLRSVVCKVLCEQLSGVFDGYASRHTSSDSPSPAADFELATKILARGIDHEAFVESQWTRAYNMLLTEARSSLPESTHLAMAVGIIEPLASSILQRSTSSSSHCQSQLVISPGLRLVCRILRSVEWPKESDTQQQAQKSLWGAPSANKSKELQDPYHNLYELFTAALDADLKQHATTRVARAVTLIIQNCPTKFFWQMLQNIGETLARWLKESKSEDAEPSHWSKLAEKLRKSWANRSEHSLSTMEPLLEAGLTSFDRDISNDFVSLWNDTIGTLPDVNVSTKLQMAFDRANQPQQPTAPEKSILNQDEAILAAPLLPTEPVTNITTRTELSQSPSRRVWLLHKSPQTVQEASAVPTLPTEIPESVVPEQPTAQVADRAETAVEIAEPEIPSSPPEVSKDPDLPMMPASDDYGSMQAEDEGMDVAMHMSDEFQQMDSSPTPLARRPLSAARSDMGIFDFPGSSPSKIPLRAQAQAQAQSDSVVADNKQASSKQVKSQKESLSRRSIASKHFPIIINDDANDAPEITKPAQAAETDAAQPLSELTAPAQQNVAMQAATATTNAQKEPSSTSPTVIIDLEAVSDAMKTRRGSIKRRLSEADSHDSGEVQPKRPRGRPRKESKEIAASTQENIPTQTAQSQKRGRGRPRKNPIQTTSPSHPMQQAQTCVPDDDDNIGDTIIVASSAESSQSSARRSRKTSVLKTNGNEPRIEVTATRSSESDNVKRNSRQGRFERRAAREQSTSSLEIVRESFTVATPSPRHRSDAPEVRVETPSSSRAKNKKSNTKSAERRGCKRRASEISDAASHGEEPISGVAEQDNDTMVAANRSDATSTKSGSRSPSSQLREEGREPQTPASKKVKLSKTSADVAATSATPSSPLSQKAQEIFASLRGLLGSVQNAVFGRSEAREIQKTLNKLSNAVLEGEERGARQMSEDPDA